MSIATTEKLLTIDDYLDLHDDGRPSELVRGRIIEMPPTRPRHGQICSNIDHMLRCFLDNFPNGLVMTNDSGVITEREPDTLRAPDIAYYSFERIARGRAPREDYYNVSPNLVFEVKSPSDVWREINEKAFELLSAGVQYVCVADPETELLYIFQIDGPVRILKAEDELSFPDLFPGWTIKVAKIFE